MHGHAMLALKESKRSDDVIVQAGGVASAVEIAYELLVMRFLKPGSFMLIASMWRA